MAMLTFTLRGAMELAESEVHDLRVHFGTNDLNDIDPQDAADYLELANEALEYIDGEEWEW